MGSWRRFLGNVTFDVPHAHTHSVSTHSTVAFKEDATLLGSIPGLMINQGGSTSSPISRPSLQRHDRRCELGRGKEAFLST